MLCTLPNGIQILRRRKHEPIDIGVLTDEELARLTNKANGSKFLPGTSLKRIVEITSEILAENGAEVGTSECYHKVFDEPMGISNGKIVRAVRVRRSNAGRTAHAYPEGEERL